jgi:hypothetical protein
MTAGIKKRVYFPVSPANDNERVVANLPGEKIAAPRDAAVMTGVKPTTVENSLHVRLINFLRSIKLSGETPSLNDPIS